MSAGQKQRGWKETDRPGFKHKGTEGREQMQLALLQIASCSLTIRLQISSWKKRGKKEIIPSLEQRRVHLNTILQMKNNEFKIDCITVLELEYFLVH